MTARLILSGDDLDLVVTQGDAFSLVLTLTDDDTGDPLDLTGFTGAMQVRRDVADRDATVAAEATVVITDNEVAFSIPHATMTTLLGTYQYDAEIVGPSGPQTLVSGLLLVKGEVTR